MQATSATGTATGRGGALTTAVGVLATAQVGDAIAYVQVAFLTGRRLARISDSTRTALVTNTRTIFVIPTERTAAIQDRTMRINDSRREAVIA
jgi:hypothetical protein